MTIEAAHNAPPLTRGAQAPYSLSLSKGLNNMRTTFDFISDPGHGWLKVNTRDLFALGLTPADFSSYSYRRGDDLYLEEDCDASLFIVRYREHTNSLLVNSGYCIHNCEFLIFFRARRALGILVCYSSFLYMSG